MRTKIEDDPEFVRLYKDHDVARRLAHKADLWPCSSTSTRTIIDLRPRPLGSELECIDGELLGRWAALHEAAKMKLEALREYRRNWFN